MNLRPYQDQAVSLAREAFIKGHKRIMLVLATGCGKTIIACDIMKRTLENGKGVLFLVNRNQLIDQTKEKLELYAGIKAAVEQGNTRSHKELMSVPIVASVQSLAKINSLQRYHPERFSLIIVDECHRSITSIYSKVFSRFPNALILGLTATPYAHGKSIEGDESNQYFKAYEITLLDAFNHNYLVPLIIKQKKLEINISEVEQVKNNYDTTGLSEAIAPHLAEIAKSLKIDAHDRTVACYTPTCKDSIALVEVLKKEGLTAVHIEGSMSKTARTKVMRGFESGKHQFISCAMLLREGWDFPPVDYIVCLRPTKNRVLIQQIIGRGLRLFKGKVDCWFIDYLWISKENDLFKPAHLLTDNENILEEINNLDLDGKSILEATKEATESIKANEDRIVAQLQAVRDEKHKEAVMTFTELLSEYKPLRYSDDVAATEKQMSSLMKINSQFKHLQRQLTKGEASAAIEGTLKDIHPTIRQRRLLSSMGIKSKGLSRYDAIQLLKRKD